MDFWTSGLYKVDYVALNPAREVNLDLSEIIGKLLVAKGANRKLDQTIAQFVGFQPNKQYQSGTAPSGEGPGRKLWISPSGQPRVSVPRYTESIDSAFELIELFSCGTSGGASWETEQGAAVISGGRYIVAANAAIALCIAALDCKLREENNK